MCVQYNNKKKGGKFYGQVNLGKLQNIEKSNVHFRRGKDKMNWSALKKKRFELHCGTHTNIPDTLRVLLLRNRVHSS